MSLSPRSLRSRVAAWITTQLGDRASRPWLESNHPYHDFPPQQDSASVAPLSFAVGLLETVADHPTDRQRREVGVLCTTVLGVRFTGQVAADDEVDDIDIALDDEVELVRVVLATEPAPDLAIRLRRIRRETIANGSLHLSTLTFDVGHFYPREA